jgi:hypothetical protein
MNLVTRGAIGVTSNLGLLVLRHNALVTAFAVHAAAPVARLCRVRIMAKATGIDVAVRGVNTYYEFAEQGWVDTRRSIGSSAVTLHATRCGNAAGCRRRRLIVVARKARDLRHAAVIHCAAIMHYQL